MKAVKIKENIYWVGGVDWDLRNFHGYLTQRGSTYNAYLVIDDKITLIDTVKHYLYDEMLDRISSVVDPSKIDYIISNHVEMDHSGSLPMIKKAAPNAEIITSPNGQKGLQKHYREEWNYRVVKSGDTLDLGKRNLHFVLTPMVHWPDNMIAYMPEEKILFSNDAFGQHLASSERFDNEYHLDIIMDEARKYYANIVLPYSEQVKKALAAAAELDISIIAPSHGIIWKDHVSTIIREYVKWSNNETKNKALIIYDTMWKSTEKIAYTIQAAFENKSYVSRMLNLQHNHISDIMTEVIDAKYICVGSPTLNNNMMPTVASFLTYLKGLAPKGRIGLAFGSYGWGGQSVAMVEDVLKSCGFEMLENIKINYVPSGIELSNILKKLEDSIT
ncbi:MAG TPA: FprA family A-type flavoprotein [Spirochaetota bacterium]|nr:FprA family A-type flavoprotein [Spirochaetota bacterium]HPI90623.1 FprA family A-type flavoprotein [Spirochaetota bacterium]HPR46865.1 FprA family A-type flavoprotein [Spirochaetota bacterium]